MTDTAQFILIFSGIWCLVGVIFLCVGIGLHRAALRRQERQRARTEGTVVHMARRYNHGYHNSGYSWHPVVEFTVDGRTLTHESSEGYGDQRYREGQAVEILYDPDDPSCFRLEGRDLLHLLGRVFLWTGLACMAVAVAAALIFR